MAAGMTTGLAVGMATGMPTGMPTDAGRSLDLPVSSHVRRTGMLIGYL
jgi:hypothetical protein